MMVPEGTRCVVVVNGRVSLREEHKRRAMEFGGGTLVWGLLSRRGKAAVEQAVVSTLFYGITTGNFARRLVKQTAISIERYRLVEAQVYEGGSRIRVDSPGVLSYEKVVLQKVREEFPECGAVLMLRDLAVTGSARYPTITAHWYLYDLRAFAVVDSATVGVGREIDLSGRWDSSEAQAFMDWALEEMAVISAGLVTPIYTGAEMVSFYRVGNIDVGALVRAGGYDSLYRAWAQAAHNQQGLPASHALYNMGLLAAMTCNVEVADSLLFSASAYFKNMEALRQRWLARRDACVLLREQLPRYRKAHH